LPGRDEGDGLWPDHLPALDAFLAIAGQWRLAPSGRFLGLDYTAVRAGLDLAGIEVTPDLWSDVQIIEAGALAGLNGKDG
jgi:hypothetical protein